ncbi:MAG: hypothetical protein AB9869_36175 [Verrucomicrobiia bacterium]
MKILLRLLFLMGILKAGQITVPAAEASSPALPVRCLFLIDTSHPLSEHKSDILNAVVARLDTSLRGQLRPGDAFLIRTFGETVSNEVDLQSVWNARSRQTLPQALAQALTQTSFRGQARLDLALKSAADFAARSEELLVVIVTDATKPFRGTPFDSRINGVRPNIPREESGTAPMIVTLLAGNGRLVGWSVEPLSSSAIPAGQGTPAPVAKPTLAAPVPAWRAPSRAPEGSTPVAAPVQAPSPKPQAAAPPNAVPEPRPETPKISKATNPPGSTPIRGELPVTGATPAPQQEVQSAAAAKASLSSAPTDVATTPDADPSSEATETAPASVAIPQDPLDTPAPLEDGADNPAFVVPEVPLVAPPASAPPAEVSQPDANFQPEASNATPPTHAEPAPAFPVQEVQPPLKGEAGGATPPASAAEPPRTSSLAFLISGSSLIAAAGVGLLCFARRRKPAPAQSLISRSIDAAK